VRQLRATVQSVVRSAACVPQVRQGSAMTPERFETIQVMVAAITIAVLILIFTGVLHTP